jgi:outer membrane protein W
MKRHNLLPIVLLTLIPFFFCPSIMADKKGQSIVSLSFGSYQTTDGTDTISGSRLSIAYLRYFVDHWAFFGTLGNGSATGEHEEEGVTTELTASTTSLSGGIQWSYGFDFNDDRSDELMPYVGVGVSMQKYDYEFSYEGSEIGSTSGSGYGPLLRLGVKIAASSHFIIIPGYSYNQITIRTEDGSDHSITSSGISLALVARF